MIHWELVNLVTTGAINLHKLHVLQKQMLRNVANVSYDYHSPLLFQKYDVMTVYDIYAYRTCISYKMAIKSPSSFFTRLSTLQKRPAIHATRSHDVLNIPSLRTNYRQQMLRHKTKSC